MTKGAKKVVSKSNKTTMKNTNDVSNRTILHFCLIIVILLVLILGALLIFINKNL